ncbi:MAG: hypothetical protein QW638_03250 [Candidatus Bathyarchaeia archaeon]|nr:hypothetical protein [Candidatus Bathyarchaeota archaeon]
MDIRRLNRAEIVKLRGRRGYILRLTRTEALLHRVSCPLVGSMNPDKGEGVYYAPTIKEALEWLNAKAIRGRACGLCLSSLTYKPRPEKLTEGPQQST